MIVLPLNSLGYTLFRSCGMLSNITEIGGERIDEGNHERRGDLSGVELAHGARLGLQRKFGH